MKTHSNNKASSRWAAMTAAWSLSAALSVCAALTLSATGLARAQSCADVKASDFKKDTLATGALLKEPIELSVAKDGEVFVVERTGDIHVYNPQTGKVTLAVHLNTYVFGGAYDVGGPLGIAAAPDFPTDNWVYIYWAPKGLWNGNATKEKGTLVYRLGRYRFVAGKIDTTTEQVLFEVHAGWETHNGGSLKFGKDDDLYLSTGDNHNAQCSDQYSPMDERPGDFWCDDQGTTANTNELRGKVLRIHPEAVQQADGKWYSIPKGNLKEKYASLWPTADLAAKVRPEIYTMGHRNPYRIFPDPVTGKLLIGEFGPAAHFDSARGPAGADQWKVTDEAAFLGYPYFLKDNQPYCHWDYAQGVCVAIQGQTSLTFDPNKPVNYSPNNTGVNILPPAKPAALWEHDGDDPDPIPGLKACGPGSGPVYHYNPALDSKVKFPPAFDNKWIFFGIFNDEWQPKLADPPSGFGRIATAVDPPWGNQGFSQGLHDMEFGPDGALYAVDYGSNKYFANSDAGLYRISYHGCLPAATLPPHADGPHGLGFAALQGPGERLSVPNGARSLSVFDLSGRKAWETGTQGSTQVTLPNGLARGLYRLLWK